MRCHFAEQIESQSVNEVIIGVDKAQLTGLYAGKPKRATTRPTAERLLKASQGIILTRIEEAGQIRYHLMPLAQLQQCMLGSLNFSADIYTGLGADSRQLRIKTSEL